MSDALQRLNALSTPEIAAELLACCGSTRWAWEVAQARPFREPQQLFETADRVWSRLDADDWLEAFRSHPKIGEKKAARDTGDESRRWAVEEQSGTSRAPASTLDELAAGNVEYEQRFGYIFIVCATGKTAEEMLEILRRRMRNNPAKELRIAAEEQRRITRLRLEKLLSP